MKPRWVNAFLSLSGPRMDKKKDYMRGGSEGLRRTQASRPAGLTALSLFKPSRVVEPFLV